MKTEELTILVDPQAANRPGQVAKSPFNAEACLDEWRQQMRLLREKYGSDNELAERVDPETLH